MGPWVPGARMRSPVQEVALERPLPFALFFFFIYFCGFQQLLRDPIPRDGSKGTSPHPDGCWELAAALAFNHPRGAAEKMPWLGPGPCSGGAAAFPPAPGEPTGPARSPGAVSRWGPFQLPALPSLSPLVILFIFPMWAMK